MADGFWDAEWKSSARELMARAKDEASVVGDDWLDTRHLFLAAVACAPPDGIPALSLEAVRASVVAIGEPREPALMMLTPWAQSPRFKLAVQCAMQRAWADSRSVTCDDIWHGLLDDPESDCMSVLRFLAVDPNSLRDRRISNG
jgi:hypothetical protein